MKAQPLRSGTKPGILNYDQGKDPVEYNNLATNPSYVEVVAEMKKLLYQKN